MPKSKTKRFKNKINKQGCFKVKKYAVQSKKCLLCGMLVLTTRWGDNMRLHYNRAHPLLASELENARAQKESFIFTRVDLKSGPPKTILKRKLYHELEEPEEDRRNTAGKKTYFDDEGNPYTLDQSKDSEDQRKMQAEDDCTEVKLDTEKLEDNIPTDALQMQYAISKKSGLDDDSSKLSHVGAVPLPYDTEDSNDNNNKEQKTEDLAETSVTQQVDSTKRRKRSAELEGDLDTSGMPDELKNDPDMHNYYKKRHSLFHRYEEGIKLDRESWFSVTPENLARHIANKYVYNVVLDAFCGAGGNTIQFAKTSKKVIAIDIDPIKISMAKHNATVYEVADRIEFIVGDFFELAPTLKADMVFLSPPWGGPSYTRNDAYDLETMLLPKPASDLMRVARTISSKIELYLPRNSKPDQIISLAKEVGGSVEIERSYLDKKCTAITAYFY